MTKHAYPAFGDRLVDQIGREMVHLASPVTPTDPVAQPGVEVGHVRLTRPYTFPRKNKQT